MATLRIGVLALQGAFREHRRMLDGLGAETRLVRWPAELDGLDGLVIPGGESTAIAKLLAIHGMYGPLRDAFAAGMAVFGTCAGAILMARDIEGARPDQEPLALMDVRIRRNAYGRQIDSFETAVPFDGVAHPASPTWGRACGCSLPATAASRSPCAKGARWPWRSTPSSPTTPACMPISSKAWPARDVRPRGSLLQ